ncbi:MULTISPECIES: hypothetical protein [Streptomycetaceae]|uniref:hypothetical protein n=1 Tax=Streptomycetaceae TaxID=2062 RepID=UPI001E57F547|nr:MULTISPECIES: hypothetical protein [Streptomycetaceae]
MAAYGVHGHRPQRRVPAPDHCYRALLAAERAAPQEVRRESVRTMAAGLMRHDRTLPGVRAFVRRVGALG